MQGWIVWEILNCDNDDDTKDIAHFKLKYMVTNITINYRQILLSNLTTKPCIKHCWGVYEQNNIVNSVHVNGWTTEWAIIASNETWK